MGISYCVECPVPAMTAHLPRPDACTTPGSGNAESTDSCGTQVLNTALADYFNLEFRLVNTTRQSSLLYFFVTPGGPVSESASPFLNDAAWTEDAGFTP